MAQGSETVGAAVPPRNPWLGASIVGIVMVLLLFVLPPAAGALAGGSGS